MHLEPYDPWERLLTLRRHMLDLFEEVFSARPAEVPAALKRALDLEGDIALPQRRPAFVPAVDIARSPRGLFVRVPLPGVSEDALEIVIDEHSLLVRGETDES